MAVSALCMVGQTRPPATSPRRCITQAFQQPFDAPQERFMHISSTANQAVKHCVKLRESARYRAEMGATLVSGRDLVEELAPLAQGPLRALVALDTAQLPPGIPAERYVTVTPPVMQKITGLGTVPPGALAAEVALPPRADLLRLPAGVLTRVLVLDGIQDPGNLGTLCRTALALGWEAAVLLPGCCDPFNDKAVKASRGAVFKLPMEPMSLEEWQQLVAAQGLVALAATVPGDKGGSSGAAAGAAAAQQQQQQQEERGDPLPPASLPDLQQRLARLHVCLCLGAEGQGLSDAVARQCRPVSIPQAAGGAVMDSLNVAAAGAILMAALSEGAAPLLAELASL